MRAYFDCILSLFDKELYREMNRVLEPISSQRTVKPRFLNASDKMVVDGCNKQIELACKKFGVRKPINLFLLDAY